MPKRIESRFEFFDDSNLWGGHVPLERETVKEFLEGDKRVLCTLNGKLTIHAALLSDGNGAYYILINKERAKKLGLQRGSPLLVELEKDTSKYGMEMPEEFEVLLEQDEEASAVFEALSPGKQRNLIHIVSVPKSSDIRLRKALAIVNYIKSTQGEIDFKDLYEALKPNR